MSNSRIPEELNPFTIYIESVDNYLNALEPPALLTKRGETLGMTLAELADLSARRLEWHTGDPANPGLWDLHQKESTKNKLTRTNVENFMKAFREFFQPLLDIMEVSRDIISADRLVLRIAEPDPVHTGPAKINDDCNSTATQLGGGRIKIANKTTADESRPSLPDDADGTEIRYIIVDTPPQDEPPAEEGIPETGGIVKVLTVNEVSQCPEKEIFSTATFELECGQGNKGRNLQYFVRWVHSKHPDNAGPWSDVYSVIIL